MLSCRTWRCGRGRLPAEAPNRAAGIIFRPMVWTADGRPHPAVTRTLKFAADVASTRENSRVPAASLLQRWRHEIQVAILRRRAAMCRAVLPRATPLEAWLLTGNADRDARAWGALGPVDEDGLSEVGDAGAESPVAATTSST